MTEIINEPKVQNPLIVKFRELLNHRAFWLYLLTDEAEKEDLTPPGALASHYKMRYITRKRLSEKGRRQKSARAEKTLFPKAARWVFEMDEGACCPAPLHFLTVTRLFGRDGSRHLIALPCRFCRRFYMLLFFGTH